MSDKIERLSFEISKYSAEIIKIEQQLTAVSKNQLPPDSKPPSEISEAYREAAIATYNKIINSQRIHRLHG